MILLLCYVRWGRETERVGGGLGAGGVIALLTIRCWPSMTSWWLICAPIVFGRSLRWPVDVPTDCKPVRSTGLNSMRSPRQSSNTSCRRKAVITDMQSYSVPDRAMSLSLFAGLQPPLLVCSKVYCFDFPSATAVCVSWQHQPLNWSVAVCMTGYFERIYMWL